MSNHLPEVIFLEVTDMDGNPRLLGTDAIFFVDRRYSLWNVRLQAELRISQMNFRRGTQLKLAGYTCRQDYSGKVHSL